MPDGFDVDFSELNTLAADLGRVPENVGPFLNSAVQFTSIKIKKGAARKVRNRKHFKKAAAAIDYDVKVFRGFGVSVIQSEIGYSKDRPVGALGNLIEFGAPGGEPHALTPGNELQSTLQEEQADFVKGLEKALEDAEKKAGL